MALFRIAIVSAFFAASVMVGIASDPSDMESNQTQARERVKTTKQDISSAERAKLERRWEQAKIEREMREAESDAVSAAPKFDKNVREIEQKYQAEADMSMNSVQWQIINTGR